jgi:hypothetical protein
MQPVDEARLVEQIKEVCAEWPAYGYRRVGAAFSARGPQEISAAAERTAWLA